MGVLFRRGFLLAAVFCAAASAAGPLDDALQALKSGDDVRAKQLFAVAAAEGNHQAEAFLGRMAEKGQGGPADQVQADEWYLKAAKGGHRGAQSILGSRLMARRRYLEASIWFRQAADQGDPFAQAMLGSLYESGSGVSTDLRAAHHWYRLAAAQGNADAATRLKALGDALPVDVIPGRAERPVAAVSGGGGLDFGDRRIRAAAFGFVFLGLVLVLGFVIRGARAAAKQ
ncbi:MAG: tetratricopeptide repeat protein [Elusimicrobiota bacterium]